MHGMEGTQSGRPETLPIENPGVQAALALEAYALKHGDERVDPAHWRENDESVFVVAMSEWVGDPDDKDTFAAHFRAYADEHPGEKIDVSDTVALDRVVASLRSYRTLH